MTASLKIARRSLPLLALAAAIRPAAAATIDLSLACDTAFAPALRKAGAAYTAKTSARVFVFPTGPGLILPQLERDIQNDIVATQIEILHQLQQARIIAAVPPHRAGAIRSSSPALPRPHRLIRPSPRRIQRQPSPSMARPWSPGWA
jgi:hypothetical protein